MALRASTKDHFDLLPFIAVLMCTLGSLLYVTLIVVALSLGPGAGEGWIPNAELGRPVKTPILIEWNGTTAVAHLASRRINVFWDKPSVARSSGGSWYRYPDRKRSPQLDSVLLILTAVRATHYALFAVRPMGFANFDDFADEFRSSGIDIGYEPIKQSRRVRLMPAKPEAL